MMREAIQNKALCVVLFDIDHFKRVNDRFGHAEGDNVLRQVAAIARQVCRSGDLLGRIGGEEFLIVLPNTSLENAAMLAERIRSRFADELKVGFPARSVTASFGIASTSEGHATLDELVEAADHHLYHAKQAGRNQVAASAPTTSAQAA